MTIELLFMSVNSFIGLTTDQICRNVNCSFETRNLLIFFVNVYFD